MYRGNNLINKTLEDANAANEISEPQDIKSNDDLAMTDNSKTREGIKEKCFAFFEDFFDKWISSGWWGVLGLVSFILGSFALYLSDTLVGKICDGMGTCLSLLLLSAVIFSMRGKSTFLFIFSLVLLLVQCGDSNVFEFDWLNISVFYLSVFLWIRSLFVGFNRKLRPAAWLLIIFFAGLSFLTLSDISIYDITAGGFFNTKWLVALKHSKVGLLIILVLTVIPAQLLPLLFSLPDFACVYIIGNQSSGRKSLSKREESIFGIIYIITIVALLGTVVFNMVMLSSS